MSITKFCTGDIVRCKDGFPNGKSIGIMWVIAQAGEHVHVMLNSNVQTNFNSSDLEILYDTLTGKFSNKVKTMQMES